MLRNLSLLLYSSSYYPDAVSLSFLWSWSAPLWYWHRVWQTRVHQHCLNKERQSWESMVAKMSKVRLPSFSGVLVSMTTNDFAGCVPAWWIISATGFHLGLWGYILKMSLLRVRWQCSLQKTRFKKNRGLLYVLGICPFFNRKLQKE